MTAVREKAGTGALKGFFDGGILLTTRRVTLAVLGLQALVLAIIAVERLGLGLPVVRPVVTVAYLTLVPGYLLVRIAGVQDAGRVETLLYSVGVSLVSLMGVGVLANLALRQVGVARPISELPIVLAVALFVCGLAAVYDNRVTEDARIAVDVELLTSPAVLGLTLLPLAGIYGALVLTRFGNNVLLVALYAVLLALPILVVAGRIPSWLLPYLVWTVSLSLLVQNALSGHYMAWGDSPKEAALALGVLRTGYWAPSLAPAFGNKYTMLRIVILHPIYALFTDLRFVWEFKLVHPLVFSLTPVALLQAYRRYVSTRAAFLAVYLFVSLFSFYIVLSRNTRTATALFFISLFLLVIAARRPSLDRRKVLAMVFVAGVVVSHYGVSYMFMVALGAAIPLKYALERIWTRIRAVDPLTSSVFVSFYLAMLFAWYIYASPGGKSFRLLIGFGQSFVDRLDEFFTNPEATSATTRYITSDFQSNTLNALKLYNVVVGGIMIVGLALTYWRVFRHREVEFDAEYLAYATVALAIFGFTFLPVERFNTARTYPTTLLFYAPFFVVGLREPLRIARRYVPRIDIDVSGTGLYSIAAVLLVVFLSLNVGFVSAVATNEYSTNALVEKDRIMDDGHPVEKNYFYKQYRTAFGVRGTDWLKTVGENNSTMYRGGWPGGPQGAVGHQSFASPPPDRPSFRQRLIQQEMIANRTTLGEGYLILSAFDDPRLGNVIRLPTGHFGFDWVYTNQSRHLWANKSRVYTNGGSQVYYS